MSKSSQLLSSLFKCNDPEPECAASFQVNLPEQIDTEVTVYLKSPLSNEVKKIVHLMFYIGGINTKLHIHIYVNY